MLTTYADENAIVPALQAGARGYLTKDASAEQIETAIRAVHAGQTHLDPAVQERLVAAVISQPPPAHPPGPGQEPPGGLTTREAEVLTLLASGLTNAEIAQRLYLSHATVKTHINRIFAKTGARDRAQAVRYAYQHGLSHARPVARHHPGPAAQDTPSARTRPGFPHNVETSQRKARQSSRPADRHRHGTCWRILPGPSARTAVLRRRWPSELLS